MPRPMGKPGAKGSEKSKDFFGSIKRLLENLKPWKVLLVISIVLALLSAILALISPDKLSTLTDTITSGIAPKTEELSTIMEKTFSNVQENLKTEMPVILSSESITPEEKETFMASLEKLEKRENQEEMLAQFIEIPDSILRILLRCKWKMATHPFFLKHCLRLFLS